MNACSVPIPPGEIGTSVARLWVTWTSSTFRIDWDPERVEEEPDRDEAKHPVAGLPECDAAEVLGAVAEDGEALSDALLELVDVDPGPEEPDRPEDHEHDSSTAENSGFDDEEAEVEAGEACRASRRPGRTPSVSA